MRENIENGNVYTDAEIEAHNEAGDSHGDIRRTITTLAERLNAVANSDDITLDQLSEIVEYIKDNREIIEIITTEKADAEDVIDIPRQVARNEIALFFYQIPDRTKETRVSIRTRAPWDATVLATAFGGGGHIRAAGCTVKGSMAVAKRKIRKAVRELLASPKN
jgi:nanoRNase/pAp phosphatase (c-di-AMP/oligoRNAs hydrolase)